MHRNVDGRPVISRSGATMSFTGERLKFADGASFQNIGIVSDVTAEPTIQGLREGRDEVLQKGVDVLKRML